MRIEPNKPQPKVKPAMSNTEQVMQVVKWGMIVCFSVSLSTPVFAGTNLENTRELQAQFDHLKSQVDESNNYPIEQPAEVTQSVLGIDTTTVYVNGDEVSCYAAERAGNYHIKGTDNACRSAGYHRQSDY